MAIEYDKLFDKIKTSLNKSDNLMKDYLKLDVGSVVNCRLVPNLQDIENSIYAYNWHSFTSRLDMNTKFSFLCPTTYGEKCPFCDKSIKLWRSDSETNKSLSKLIRRRNNWLVNVYVINDNKNPENNGKVKILQFGFQLHQKIKEAIEMEEYGKRVWMLNEHGCTFRLKCDKNTEKKDSWPTYNASTFLPPSRIEGMTPDMEETIINSAFKLESKIKKYTYSELVDILNKHFEQSNVSDVNAFNSDSSPRQPVTPSPETNTSIGGTSTRVESVEEIDDVDLNKWLNEVK